MATKGPDAKLLRSTTYALSVGLLSTQPTWISLPESGVAITPVGGRRSADAAPAEPIRKRPANAASKNPLRFPIRLPPV
jgi:hypothetical protein